MAINLGKDPSLLIAITFFEIFLILIPALIASKIEKRPIIEEFREMGFQTIQKLDSHQPKFIFYFFFT